MRFHGEYQHTVDSKGRVSLPAKFRKALPEEVVIVPTMAGALSVFSEEAFEAWVDSLFTNREGENTYDPMDPTSAMLRKQLNANAENATVDSAGRITISAKKRKSAQIDRDVYIIGDTDHVEIWSAASYEEQMAGFSFDAFMRR